MGLKHALWDVWLSRWYWRLRFAGPQRSTATAAMRVRPGEPAYRAAAEQEAIFWENPPLTAAHLEAGQTGAARRFANESQTGDPSRSWMDDLIARGPFERAAVLGSTQGSREAAWLAAGGSRELDVFDISSKVLARARRVVRAQRQAYPEAVVRFFRSDLNFVQLARGRYDVVWSTGCLHHVTNLEYLMDEVAAALRPGGLFALQDYVGEARSQYDPARLARANEVLRSVPAQYRRATTVGRPSPAELSPFEAIRSDEILRIAAERFDVVHLSRFDALHPLFMLLDTAALEREQPEALVRLLAAETAARRQPGLACCSAYAVYAKRAGT